MDDGETEAPTVAVAGLDDGSGALPSGSVTDPQVEASESLPDVVGRYRPIGRLGHGGMATVLLAVDETLDRRVALKLVAAPTSRPRERARVLREAQAMARLQHPNVVPVFDVGEHGEHVFIAMERIVGRHLAQWVRSSSRSHEEIVAVYLQAARGLIAVHEAGLVHRDFKPHNVVLGEDGRARIIDFGLAHTGDQDRSESASGTTLDAALVSDSLDVRLTEAGSVMGTPAYMSPEQVRQQPTTPASDQFSFCVALFEALYGVRPFEGRSFEELGRNIALGRIREVDERRVRRRVSAVIRRGLQVSPRDRWPDMAALVHALESACRKAHRRWLPTMTAGLVVGGVWLSLGAADQPCREVAIPWDAATRERVRESVLTTEVDYAAGSWERLDAQLGDYAAQWLDAYQRTCGSALELQEHELELRLACLHHRRDDFQELVDESTELTASTVERVTGQVSRLQPIATCLEAATRDNEEIADAEDPRIDALRQRLSEANAMRRAGQLEEARREATAVLDEARQLGVGWLQAKAWSSRAFSEQRAEQFDAARDDFERAYHEAIAVGADHTAAKAAIQLANLSVRRSAFDEAQNWITHGRAALQRVGDPERTLSTLLDNEARMFYRQGRYEQAAATYERTIEVRIQAYGDPSDPLAATLDHYGSTLRALSKLDEALQVHERALTMLEAIHGPQHPEVGRASGNLGHALSRLGREEDALVAYDRALSILRAGIGPEHSDVAAVLASRGSTALALGDIDQARADLTRALEIESMHTQPDDPARGIPHNNLGNVELQARNFEQAEYHYRRAYELYVAGWGAEHPYASVAYLNLARVAGARGDPALAVQRYEDALSRLEASHPSGHLNLGMACNNLATELVELGRLDEAEAHFRRALEIMKAQLPSDDGRADFPQQGLANVAFLRGEPERTVELLTPVLQQWEDHAPTEHDLAEAQLLMARALNASGESLDRVRSLVAAARHHFIEHDDDEQRRLADALHGKAQ